MAEKSTQGQRCWAVVVIDRHSIEHARSCPSNAQRRKLLLHVGQALLHPRICILEHQTDIGRAVILLQEWWGVSREILDFGASISNLGYRVVIPDLYDGSLALSVAEAEHNMNALNWVQAKDDIVATAAFLKKEGAPRVGITGTCMGGALALVGAVHADVDCCAPFYGTPDPSLADTSTITIPVEAHFGALDNLAGFSDVEAANMLKESLAKNSPGSVVHIYDGVGHGFMNSAPDKPKISDDVSVETGFPPAQKDVQQLAFERLEAFFAKHLKQ